MGREAAAAGPQGGGRDPAGREAAERRTDEPGPSAAGPQDIRKDAAGREAAERRTEHGDLVQLCRHPGSSHFCCSSRCRRAARIAPLALVFWWVEHVDAVMGSTVALQATAVGTGVSREEDLQQCLMMLVVVTGVLLVAVGALLHAWLASWCSALVLEVEIPSAVKQELTALRHELLEELSQHGKRLADDRKLLWMRPLEEFSACRGR